LSLIGSDVNECPGSEALDCIDVLDRRHNTLSDRRPKSGGR
jgi:hypothetical protein